MSYAGFAVYHVEKGTISSGGIGKHIDREKGSEHTYRHADPSRRHLNKNYKVYGDRHKMKLSDAINERIKEGYKNKAKIRKNAVKYVTHILTGSHEDMKKMEENGTLNDWVKENYEFISQEYGFENIVRFTLHMDEKTPHLHAVTIPLTKDGRLSAFEIIGNRKKMQERQDRYAERMEQFGLRRGVKSTGITHEGAKEYYTRMSLANEIAKEKTEGSIPMETQIKALKALNRKLKIENQKAYLPKRMRERVAHVGKYIKERDEILAEKKAIEQKISSYENEIKGLEKKAKEEEKHAEIYRNLYSERSSLISQYNSQINDLKAEKERLLSEKEEAENKMQEELQGYKSSYEFSQTKIEFLKGQNQKMFSEITQLVKEKDKLEEFVEKTQEQLKSLRKELEIVEKSRDQKQFELEKIKYKDYYDRSISSLRKEKPTAINHALLFALMYEMGKERFAELLDKNYIVPPEILELFLMKTTKENFFISEEESLGFIMARKINEKDENHKIMDFLYGVFLEIQQRKSLVNTQENQQTRSRGFRR